MSHRIDIQKVTKGSFPISAQKIKNFARLALRDYRVKAELTIRLVEASEMVYLNHSYRKKNKVTNVLSFPAVHPSIVELNIPFLGDIIICPEVVALESKQFNKTIEAHWALMVIHGTLHLLGFDHVGEEDALVMQSQEIKLLAELGLPNPYKSDYHDSE